MTDTYRIFVITGAAARVHGHDRGDPSPVGGYAIYGRRTATNAADVCISCQAQRQRSRTGCPQPCIDGSYDIPSLAWG
jgi:hypothetical protein